MTNRKAFLTCMSLFLLGGCVASQDTSLSVPTALASSQTRPAESDDLSGVRVTLNNAVAFALDGLSFQFAIVSVHVQADGATNIPLSHFTTSEGIRLDETDAYVSKLEDNSLYLGRQNVWFSLISQDSTYNANLFVPVADLTADSVTLSCDFGDNADMQISLADPQGTREMLQYQADDIITDGKTYQLTVSDAFEITGEYLYQTNGNVQSEYLLPSTTKVYAFQIDAVSLWGDDIIIREAEYVTSSGDTFTALDSSIQSMKLTNILDRTISESDTGYLFFYAFDPDDHPVTYTGVLKLRLEDSSWITINVDLN